MKVLLLNHVKGLGQKGEVKEVSEGYFLNSLAPRKLATTATANAVQHMKNQKEKAMEKLEMLKESAESIKGRLHEKTLELKERASESGKLYASVSAQEIALGIKTQFKVEIPVKSIQLEAHIKEAGTFKIRILLYKDVFADLNIHVTSN